MEEITLLRALISRVTASLDVLPVTERAGIDHAVAAVRRHRAAMLGMPRCAGNGDQERPA